MPESRTPGPRPALLLSCSVILLALTACSGEDERPPAPPTGVTAQSSSATTVHVMWKGVQTAKDGEGVAAYEVLQAGKKVKEVGAERTMVDITGLKPSADYEFTVRTRDTGGNYSAPSREVAVTTLAAPAEDGQPPTRPGRLRGRADGSRAADLRWTASTDDQRVVSYDIYQGGAKIHTVDGAETRAVLTGLRPGTGYVFTVRARDAAGNLSPASAPLRLTTAGGGGGGGAEPENFQVSVRKDAKDRAYYLDLSWTPPRPDGLVAEYQVYLDEVFVTTLAGGDEPRGGRARHTVNLGTEEGRTYDVRIRPRLPDGTWGAFSLERTVTTGN
ncbi:MULTISPECIES: fibronectin type III domain-containing protein [unclassified Streptomyces]|uniref:fibronectin type III domain-containing protein n=1 Tax=unclassified Streptomyces TaxID=2593676 RepID=UPI0036F09183